MLAYTAVRSVSLKLTEMPIESLEVSIIYGLTILVKVFTKLIQLSKGKSSVALLKLWAEKQTLLNPVTMELLPL